MVQNFGFEYIFDWYEFEGLVFSVTIHTLENIYVPDGATCKEDRSEAELGLSFSALRYAGGRKACQGAVEVLARVTDKAVHISISAEMEREVRCIRLLLRGRENGVLLGRVDATPLPITHEGVTLAYPEAWRTLAVPMVVVQTSKSLHCYRSLDTRVAAKRFVFSQQKDGLLTELICDAPATELSHRFVAPEWEIRTAKTMEEAYAPQIEHMQKAYCLEKWENRGDVPTWAREISLVVALHGMHWSGKIFNTYAEMLHKLEWLSHEIKPARVLVYLPGFEGRYYWQYGSYEACEDLGGAKELHALVAGAKEMGYHIVPMLGVNIVNTQTPEYESFGVPSQFITTGGIHVKNIVDWDASRGYDHGWCGYLNPAAPRWKSRLLGQITHLLKTYGFDGVYLDITGMWIDDANFDVAEGTRELVRCIRRENNECLVLGEAWYDGIASAFPFVQNGHTDGKMHYYDDAYAPLFDTFNRMFGHLCLGDVGSHSTGVHELGWNNTTEVPLRKGVLPTITLLGDTIEKNAPAVQKLVAHSKEYALRFLLNEGNSNKQLAQNETR